MDKSATAAAARPVSGKSKLYTLGLEVRDHLLKKNGHFTVREFKRSMNLCLYKAMDPDLRQRYMVSFFLNACAIYSFNEPKDLPEVNKSFPYFEEAVYELKKVMYAGSPQEQNFDVGKVIAILYQLDKQYGWDFNNVASPKGDLYQQAKQYGHPN